jgi:chemotaxis protein CheX
MASSKVLREACFVEPKVGRPYVRDPMDLDNTIIIMISFTYEVACDIASKMIMMPITELDELATSAISELGNMILGNAATIFSNKGIKIDITPPTIVKGTMSFSHTYTKSICIPIEYDEQKVIEINIAIKGNK